MNKTAKDRAKWIVKKFNSEGACLFSSDETYLQELIEIAIDCAEQAGREEGYKQAVEDAAKQTECFSIGRNELTTRNIVKLIAQAIRNLPHGEGKEKA